MAPAISGRITRVSAGNTDLEGLIQRMLKVAQEGLPRMFLAERDSFAFTRKRQTDGQVCLAGESLRYGAISVLGASHLSEPAQRAVFGGASAREFTQRMIEGLVDNTNLGDQALVIWAAAEQSMPQIPQAIEQLRRRNGGRL